MSDINPSFHVSGTTSPFRHLSKRVLNKLNNVLVPYLISSVCTPSPHAIPFFRLAIAISTISVSKCILSVFLPPYFSVIRFKNSVRSSFSNLLKDSFHSFKEIPSIFILLCPTFLRCFKVLQAFEHLLPPI